MQETKSRRSNVERTETTRAALLAAGRRLFVEKGYAGTGTPELVAAAGVTRGALYHHFADKSALFRAVVEAESISVAEAVEKAAPVGLPPLQALTMGGEAFLDAMLVPGRTRLLLVDGPAVLGRAEMDRIDEELGAARTLREGLAAAMRARAIARLPVEPLAAHLAAAFDRAALAIEAGASRSEHGAVLAALIGGLAATR
jgi:AcrR family transcriptional regulator